MIKYADIVVLFLPGAAGHWSGQHLLPDAPHPGRAPVASVFPVQQSGLSVFQSAGRNSAGS